ncbi:MAG: PhoU domain-containing protein [Thermodesulfobacteriota bacterium]
MENLPTEILKVGGLIEELLDLAARSFLGGQGSLVQEIEQKAARLTALDRDINDYCLRLLAGRQPAAGEWRLIWVSLRLSRILENMADLAVKMAHLISTSTELPAFNRLRPIFLEMVELAKAMVRGCLDALAQRDVQSAGRISPRYDLLDDLSRRLMEEALSWMLAEDRLVRRGMNMILAGRFLERIGGLAVIAAEEVIYLVEGAVIEKTGTGLLPPTQKGQRE